MNMMLLEAIEQERMAFLCELYTRSAGDSGHGVPYEELIDALGFGEAVTKRLQGALHQEGLVELTIVPPMTHVSRPVADHEHRHRRHQTIGMTHQGVREAKHSASATISGLCPNHHDLACARHRNTVIICGVPRTHGMDGMEGKDHASRRS
jgi:hypothetical protein